MSANERSGWAAQAEPIGGLVAIISLAAEGVMCTDPATTTRGTKADRSPISAADEAANKIIVGGLRQLLPGLPIISEASVAHTAMSAAGGCVTAPDGEPLAYGRAAENFRVPAFFAWGGPALAADLKLPGPPC